MKKELKDLLEDWPRSFIKSVDVATLLGRSENACRLVIKRALKAGILIRIKKGFYLIARKLKRQPSDEFELALLVYGPSFVSLESALSHHGWIPETVHTTTCVSTKRAKEFATPVGVFSYKRVPEGQFFTGVERIETEASVVFVATPWRALADFMYVRRKHWKSLDDLEADLRIDKEALMASDYTTLRLLAKLYPSKRVRENLKKFLKEITGKPWRSVNE